MKGKWRIVEIPDYEISFMEPAYILFDGEGGGEFAFDCVTGTLYEAGEGESVEFGWQGNDEMDEASGEGWAELQPDGSITGQISFDRGEEVDFVARPWISSSNKR